MKTDKETSKNGESGNHNHYSELPESENPSSVKISKKESRKSNKEVKESRILRRSKTLKDKNDPDRFCGEGINFKAKIIGTEHVFDARGNRMCQGALQRLKAAVKTSGDHKQRIILNISYNGIIIKDEKTGEILHHHPIHKISFISQDTVDKRSFGYVFGCPQSGHEFFGIKTEKIASHVVLTLRDLFLAALEMKKKEIESAKESQKEAPEISNKVSTNGNSTNFEKGSNSMNGAHSINLHDELLYSNRVSLPEENVSPEASTATLLDLQFTMDNLQMGISHMDHSIATAASQGFGLSFSEDDISESSSASLPLAFHYKVDKFNPLCQETLSVSSRSSSTSDYNVYPANESKIVEETDSSKTDVAPSTVQSSENFALPQIPSSKKPSPPFNGKLTTHNASIISSALSETAVEDRYAVFQDIDAIPSIFDNPTIVLPNLKDDPLSCVTISEDELKEETPEKCEIKTSTPIVFAELDPLGNLPFIDKRDFFQDIKNPPKKVLKDLVGGEENSVDANSSFENNQIASCNSSDLFPSSSRNDSFEEAPITESLLPDQKPDNPFIISSIPSGTPPKLPPKRTMTLITSDFPPSKEDKNWESKNPFNPFVDDDFPDIPPPNSPPPPPPPRLPSKACEAPLVTSPPPPRPPSRSNGIPTPPLPKRKAQLSSAGNTWFSFDQEVLNFPVVHSTSNVDNVPPLPSPARKFPSSISESSNNSSTSSSPATNHRAQCVTNAQIDEGYIVIAQNSLPETRHSSIEQEESSGSSKLFSETCHTVESKETLDSPPLPPKPLSIARPRPSPSKKTFASMNSSLGSSMAESSSSSLAFSSAEENKKGFSVGKKTFSSVTSSSLSGFTAESSNGAHSSSSLAFSSSEENKMGSSAEGLFHSSSSFGENHTDVFFQNDSVSKQSSTSELAKELSPDSIFRRKSDPFADDFFLSLSRKSNDMQKNSKGVDLHFESLEASS